LGEQPAELDGLARGMLGCFVRFFARAAGRSRCCCPVSPDGVVLSHAKAFL
jgi:hypothetical protein